MKPWFGLHLPYYTFPDTLPERLFDRVVEQARAAEAAGFSLVTVMDHLNQIPGSGPQTDPMLEGWSTLAALARETRTVRLGTLVSGVTYRNPALLAKTATTLDVISGGRAVFGLGAAWFEAEHVASALSSLPIGERMDRAGRGADHRHGDVRRGPAVVPRPLYRIDDGLNVPRPIQPGGPRILVGGGGEQRTLRIAAKHADMTHWFPLGFDVLQHKTEILAAALRGDRARSRDDRAHDGVAGAGRGDEHAKRGDARGCPRRSAAHVVGTPERRPRDCDPTWTRLHRLHVQQQLLPGAGADRGLGELLRVVGGR